MRSHSLNALSDTLALMPDAPAAPSPAPAPARLDADYDDLVVFHGIERERLVLIHPGSHGAQPAWAVERYAEVADQLAADGWQIAIVGDALEPERTGAVLGAMQTAALFLAGTMSPETLTRLIGDARLVLSDDAATPSPVAAARALGTPLIALEERHGDATSEAVAIDARAALASERAHPGDPFTLHTPALPDAA
jgi:ADP-heptose:LPS heptosyltransferase